jgi:hypothetical protein
VSLQALKNSVSVVSLCNDYNVARISSFLVQFDKAGKERMKIDAPVDVQFMHYEESQIPLLLGSQLTHPESTLIPYVSGIDSSRISWTFSDSTVFGLAHITYVQVKDYTIYFLGDDTGDATGTISVFQYILTPPQEIEIKQKPVKKKK